jgi:DNA-binding NarL/FixJ family response regulator
MRDLCPSGRGERAQRDLASRDVPNRAASDTGLHSLLSPRERQVLAATALGLTNGEVAQRLEVSIHAVKFHLAAVYRKLGVANRTEAAVIYATSQARQAP